METSKVACNGCGASLAIGGSPQFVTCRFCGASLRIVRTDSAVFTELREEVQEIRDEVRALRRESKLRALDDEWEARSRALMVEGKNGRRSRPTRGGAIAVAVMGAVAGTMFSGFAWSHEEGEAIGFFGVVFGLFAVGIAVHLWKRADQFDREELAYLDERAELETSSARRR